MIIPDNLFQLVDTEFKLSFDPEELTTFSDVPVFIHGKSVIPKDTPCWIHYDNAFEQFIGFHISNPVEAAEIYSKIHDLRTTLLNSSKKSSLVNEFLSREILISNINILRLKPRDITLLHKDAIRNLTLNIGLKNSNSHVVTMYDGEVIPGTLINENNKKFSFTMNDGDAYILKTSQPHRVDPISDNAESNKNRYIISYSL